jgi:UDP-N-acetylmuramyl pentapeptide synthase
MVAEVNPDRLVAAGRLGKEIAEGANRNGYDSSRIETFMTAQEVVENIVPEISEGDQVLIKASRAMQFEKIVRAFKEKQGVRG